MGRTRHMWKEDVAGPMQTKIKYIQGVPFEKIANCTLELHIKSVSHLLLGNIKFAISLK